jgi:putative CocE/NonD family hydrolase
MTGEFVPPRSVVVDYDVSASMRDGTILRCDIARPAGEGRWPVILIRSPYNKNGIPHGALQTLTIFARQGFVAIIQDVRDRFASDGDKEFTPFTGDFDDGDDTIAWAASLPFSSGDIFTYGMSYHAYVQWALAVRRPPALRAIMPIMSPGRPRRTMFFTHGVWELELMASWFCFIGFETLRRRHKDDPGAFAAASAQLMKGFESLTRGEFGSLPLDRFEPLLDSDIAEHFFGVLGAASGDHPIIESLEATQDFSNVAVPALLVGGWYDCFSQGTIDQFVGMRAGAGSEEARRGTRLIMGPWGHATGLRQMIGERNFGITASMSALAPDAEIGVACDFFRAQLAGADDPQKPVKIFVMGANSWRDETDWPIARTEWNALYLAGSGEANGPAGDGRLAGAPVDSPADRYCYDPADPVPTRGGGVLGFATMAGPRDQRVTEQRSDVLLYTSAILREDLEVTGSAKVELWAAIDCADTDFITRLVDVHPDGTSYNIAEGILRGRYRDDPDSFGPGTPMEPGQAYRLEIELCAMSNLFKVGHRIGLQVTSSNFPRWARNLNIWDQEGATLADARIASVSIFHDQERPSRILLPTIPPA